MTTISTNSSGVVLTSPAYTNPVVIDPGVTVSGSGNGVLANTGTWTIQNAGSIAGNATSGKGIYLAGGGYVTNQSSAAISGLIGIYTSGAPSTVVNAGSIAANPTSGTGVWLEPGGIVTNQRSAAISGVVGIAATGNDAVLTVVNYGHVTGNTTYGFGGGVNLFAGGSVTNQSGATISGYNGINSGATGAVTVMNAGRIGGYGLGSAVNLTAGGMVSNGTSGLITGNVGVFIIGLATVVNAGSIAGN
jgi:hypothetical protein